jgi:hypothetical protein
MSPEQRDEEMNGSLSGLPATPDLGTWSEKPLTNIPQTSYLVAADVTFQSSSISLRPVLAASPLSGTKTPLLQRCNRVQALPPML